MNIQTRYHGELIINEKDVIGFPKGIPGFIEEKEFVVLPLEDESSIYILQSLKNPTLAFVIVNPFHYFPEYDFNIDDQVVENLKISSSSDVLVYSILTVQKPFENTTANLQAPIIINANSQQGKQIILNDDKYKTRHKILEKRCD